MPRLPLIVAAESNPAQLGGLAGWAVDLVETLGGPGAGLAIAVENLFPPLPSELILPLTGFAAARGVLTVPAAIAWTTGGSVLGALVLYWLGATLGHDRLARIWARLPLVDDDDLTRTTTWFEQHGRRAVFFGRMVPIFRSLISVPAGVERMPLLQFTIYTTLGSLIWNTVLVMGGYVLGDRYEVIAEWVGRFSNLVLLGAVLAVVAFVVLRVRRRRHRAAAEADS